jgi:hypothetical protein
LQNDLLDLPPGPDQQITAATLKDEISLRYNFSLNYVETTLMHFLEGLSELMPISEMKHLRAALPEDLSSLFPEAKTSPKTPQKAA